MTVTEDKPGTRTIVTEVRTVNPDGSIKVDRTVETVSSPECYDARGNPTIPYATDDAQYLQTVTIAEPMHAASHQEVRHPIAGISIVAGVLAFASFFLGMVAATGTINQKVAIGLGVPAIFALWTATPLQYQAARIYLSYQPNTVVTNKGLLTGAWVLYTIASIIAFIAILQIAFWDYGHIGWSIFTFLGGLVAWGLMFSYGEQIRRQ
jgi:hypothetical protein